jgi:hypothetical protein
LYSTGLQGKRKDEIRKVDEIEVSKNPGAYSFTPNAHKNKDGKGSLSPNKVEKFGNSSPNKSLDKSKIAYDPA